MSACFTCERQWSGYRECHCSGCCKYFPSVSAFDAHQSSTGCLGLEDPRWRLFESARPGGVVWVTSLGGYQLAPAT